MDFVYNNLQWCSSLILTPCGYKRPRTGKGILVLVAWWWQRLWPGWLSKDPSDHGIPVRVFNVRGVYEGRPCMTVSSLQIRRWQHNDLIVQPQPSPVQPSPAQPSCCLCWQNLRSVQSLFLLIQTFSYNRSQRRSRSWKYWPYLYKRFFSTLLHRNIRFLPRRFCG